LQKHVRIGEGVRETIATVVIAQIGEGRALAAARVGDRFDVGQMRRVDHITSAP
jgi:hypothetical protein